MDLSKSLRISIATKGIRQKELAESLSTSRQQIGIWLATGVIKQSSLVDICKYFEVKVSEFIKLGE